MAAIKTSKRSKNEDCQRCIQFVFLDAAGIRIKQPLLKLNAHMAYLFKLILIIHINK